MTRLSERFARLRRAGDKALMPFVTAGDPDLTTTAELVIAMAEAGADAIELGVPFSDPIADGPTIQRASERALAGGTTLRRILALVKQLRPQLEIPLLLMGYANPFYALGAEGFAQEAAAAGVDGVICPDLPPEEGADLYGALEKAGVDAVLLAAPTTTPKRLALLAERTRGFLYCVSLTGVTGARSAVAQGVEASVRAAKALRDVPVCVGFGVSTPAHAAEIGRYADGVVVGGAIVDRIERAKSRDAAVTDVARFVAELKAPLRGRPK
jgi:tryptophan synthase alpha chain